MKIYAYKGKNNLCGERIRIARVKNRITRGKSKNTLLTLTERKTRAEIIFKLPDHSAESVVGSS